MPLLNDVQAAGQTPLQLAADITAGLKKFVTDPQVTVIVTTINSQRVYILGEVNQRRRLSSFAEHDGAASVFKRRWIFTIMRISRRFTSFE